MATNHSIRVRGREITVSNGTMPSRGRGSDTISLDLDAEWDGLSTVVVLGSEGRGPGPVKVIYEGGMVEIPEAAMSVDGFLPVSVVGYDSSGEVRLTTYAADRAIEVRRSGEVDGSEPPPEAPDVMGQLLSAASDARGAADAATQAASKLLQDAEEGRFDGAPGPPGRDGSIPFATCDTPSATQTKAVSVDGFALGGGVRAPRTLLPRELGGVTDARRLGHGCEADMRERLGPRRAPVVG